MQNHNLKHIRKHRGLTLLQVAVLYEELTGNPVTQSTLSHWENGTQKITADNILVLAKIYGCSTDMLLGREFDEGELLHDMFYSLPKNEQVIANYAFEEWHGDIHALMNVMGAYLSMPDDVRGELLLYLITRYSEEKQKGNVSAYLPINDKYLKQSLNRIMK